jgi:hypothetical protein
MMDAHYNTKLLIWHVSMRQLGDATRRKLRIRDNFIGSGNNLVNNADPINLSIE